MHIFHDWLGWSEPFKSAGGGPVMQQRCCSYCNKLQVRVVHPPRGWKIAEPPAQDSQP